MNPDKKKGISIIKSSTRKKIHHAILLEQYKRIVNKLEYFLPVMYQSSY
jgi:hypothetical protein